MSDASWAIVYLAAYIVMLAWTRRADFRRPATRSAATLDLLGGICLSIPALAWLDVDVAARCGNAALRLLFVLGLVSLAWFTRADVRKALANPVVASQQRGRFAGLTLVAALLGAGPDLWWGFLALVHAPRA